MAVAPTQYEDVLDLLRSKGLRMTPQRRAIVSEVMRTNGHISPAAIARTIEGEMPGVNPSTVYRTIALLEEVGVLQHSHLESGAEYHKADEAQHVHLTCHRCGRDDALSLEEATKLGRLIHQHHGFVADLTHFAITGLCKGCAAA
jgi:Fur family ferric uptake transcriptional regulator